MQTLPHHPDIPLGQRLGLDAGHMLHYARDFYAARFRHCRAGADLDRALQDAVIAQGGTLVEPTRYASDTHWGPMGYELSLLGCTALGTTKLELVRNWCKAAARMAEASGAKL